MENTTLKYYEQNAQSFIDSTFSSPVVDTLQNFISRLPKGGKILDVGCGSGRDSLYFLNNGFDVVAFDNSPELAKLAAAKINHPVLVEQIENMAWQKEFDGVWAMASLLHLPKKDLKQGILNCHNALKDGGVFLSAYKMGNDESYDEKGRFFSYYQLEEIISIYKDIDIFEDISYTIKKDSLGREGLDWITITAIKKPQLQYKPSTKIKF